jgi:hypothetical protein
MALVYTDMHSRRVFVQLTCVQVAPIFGAVVPVQAQVGVSFMKAGASKKGHSRLGTRVEILDSNG